LLDSALARFRGDPEKLKPATQPVRPCSSTTNQTSKIFSIAETAKHRSTSRTGLLRAIINLCGVVLTIVYNAKLYR
jgi:hypothetical protein